MVAVKAHQAAAFMKSPPPRLTAALFFGSDPGLVSERSAVLAAMLADRETPRAEILRLDDAELDDDPGRLETELQMRPMFSSRRIVRAIAGRRISAPLLKPLLGSGPLEGLLIVEAGNLKSDDSLKALFETSAGCVAVACYPDSAADIDTLITDVLAPFSLAIEPDARALLQSRLGADRTLSRAEIEKLAIFCLGQSPITVDKVESIVGDAADLALERIAEAAAEGRTQAAVTDFGRAIASGESAQTIILITQRYFLKLHKVRSDVDAGQRPRRRIRVRPHDQLAVALLEDDDAGVDERLRLLPSPLRRQVDRHRVRDDVLQVHAQPVEPLIDQRALVGRDDDDVDDRQRTGHDDEQR